MADSCWITAADATGNRKKTLAGKTYKNSNPVQTGLNIVLWSEAEKFMGWRRGRQTMRQTSGDFGLALKPASDWLISFRLSAERDKSNGVCIDHLTMIIRPDANGQVIANDKDLDMEIVVFFGNLSLFVHSSFSSLSLHHVRF